MTNVQVRIDQVVNNETAYNVTYWQFPDFSSTTLQEFADALRTSYDTNAKSKLSDLWELLSITVRQMDGGGSFSIIQTFTSGSLEGTGSGALLPNQIALLVSTGYVGAKPNRGRIYFPALTEASNGSNGFWDGSTRTAFEDMVNEWKDGLSTTAGSCLLRIARPDFPSNTWTLNNPVESVIARNVPATQRRRRVGVGS